MDWSLWKDGVCGLFFVASISMDQVSSLEGRAWIKNLYFSSKKFTSH